MKKNIAMFMTVVANILLLVHIVVPHHSASHQIDFCNVSVHKMSSKTKQCPHTDNHGISQNGDKETSRNLAIEDCHLDKIHVRINEQNDNINTSIYSFKIAVCFISTSFANLLSTHIEIKEKLLAKYIAPIYSFTPTSTFGLRAPPY